MSTSSSVHPHLEALTRKYAKEMDQIMGQLKCVPSDKYLQLAELGSAFMADWLSVTARIKAEQELEEPLFY
jgi:hypothetical protein